MDAKTLNALVHDREAAVYDDRFLIEIGPGLGRDVRRELTAALGSMPSADRVLDVACGTGYLALGVASAGIGRRVHGTDLSVEMLRRTRANAAELGVAVDLVAADAERLPYRSGAFDLVVIRGALHHVPDPVAMLRECRRLLGADGAVVCIAEPTPSGERQVGALVGSLHRAIASMRKIRGATVDRTEHETWELASIAANLHTFTPQRLDGLARDAGFTAIRVGSSSWAWILTLGLHYYVAGEFPRLWKLAPLRRAARGAIAGANALDRAILDALIPSRFHHTIWGVFR